MKVWTADVEIDSWCGPARRVMTTVKAYGPKEKAEWELAHGITNFRELNIGEEFSCPWCQDLAIYPHQCLPL